jgi:hypothetical protein
MGVLFDEVTADVLLRVKIGLLAMTHADYEMLRDVLRGRDFKTIGERIGRPEHTSSGLWAQFKARCGGASRMDIIRARQVLENDPQVVAYVAALTQWRPGTWPRRRPVLPHELQQP